MESYIFEGLIYEIACNAEKNPVSDSGRHGLFRLLLSYRAVSYTHLDVYKRQANDLMVLSDEVYERLIYDGEKHVSIASLPGMKERTFTLNGMSKAYAMDGWRLGYVAAPEEYILAMNKFHQYNTTCAPNFVQLASAAALNEEGDEVNAMVREYKRRRNHAVKAINEIPGLSCQCPKGAFYIFINIKELGMKSAEAADYLLELSLIHI